MGCASSKPSKGSSASEHVHEEWQKQGSPSTIATAAAATADPATPLPHLVGTSASDSDSSTHSESQLSTWDMRTMQGPLAVSDTPTSAPPGAITPIEMTTLDRLISPQPTTTTISEGGVETTTPLPFPLLLGQIGSSPSLSQRLRSPSILGTPSLDTPVVEAAGAAEGPTSRLVVTKVGGCTLVNQYLVVQYLGRGTSGKVFLCMDVLDRRLYAVKIVRKTPRGEAGEEKEEEDAEGEEEEKQENEKKEGGVGESQDSSFQKKHPRKGRLKKRPRDPLADLRREIEILRSLSSHPNVVSLREVVDDPTTNKMLIVMEYCEGGPVMTRTGLERGRRIPEAVARPYFRDMVASLEHLHANRIIHGDLKPENALMCATGRVELSDFGCSKILPPGSETVDRCNGTPAFLAPEMMAGAGAVFRGKPADVYALGACLFTFIYGKIPFTADTVAELFEVVKTQELVFPEIPEASEDVKNLLRGLLTKDPAKRLTLDQAGSHPWTTEKGRLPPATASASKRGSKNNKKVETPEEASAEHPHLVDRDSALADLINTPGLEIATFASGQWLMRQGDRSASLMFIVQGQVEVLYKPSSETCRIAASNTSTGGTTPGAPSAAAAAAAAGLASPVAPLRQAITKLLSPSARMRSKSRGSRTSPSATIQEAEAEIEAAAAGGGVQPLPLSTAGAQENHQEKERAAAPLSVMSPRLAAALSGMHGTPEPSPRFPGGGGTAAGTTDNGIAGMDSTATNVNLNSTTQTTLSTAAFHLPLGQAVAAATSMSAAAAAGAAPGGQSTVTTPGMTMSNNNTLALTESVVTTPRSTPAITPLPSARENNTSSAMNIISSTTPALEAETEADGREQTPFFTPMPMPISMPAAAAAQAEESPFTQKKEQEQSHEELLSDSAKKRLAAHPVMFTPRGEPEERKNPTPTIGLPPLPPVSRSASASPTKPPLPLGSAMAAPTTTAALSPQITSIAEESPTTDPDSASYNELIGLKKLKSSSSFWTNDLPPQAQLSRAFSARSEATEVTEVGASYLLIGEDSMGLSSDASMPLALPLSVPSVSEDGEGEGGSFVGEQLEQQPKQEPQQGGVLQAMAAAALEAQRFVASLRRDAASVDAENVDKKKSSGNSGGRGNSGEYLLAIRSAGDFLGETALIGGSALRRSCSVRAVSDQVHVVVVPYSQAKEHFKANPLAKQRLAELVWSRQSEIIVQEGLLRLSGIANEVQWLAAGGSSGGKEEGAT